MSNTEDLPIFPLRTILFPDSKLPLRIFEPRYIDMVSRCMREDSEFGIILSRESTDPKMFETYDTGTLAKIIDWDQGEDGLLGITTIGTQKFRPEFLCSNRGDSQQSVLTLIPINYFCKCSGIIGFKHFWICAFSTQNDSKLTIFSHTSADHINISWFKDSEWQLRIGE